MDLRFYRSDWREKDIICLIGAFGGRGGKKRKREI